MHSRFHGGTQPFVCPDCGAAFLRKFELVNHERQHGRIPESCPACGKEFLQRRTLLVHVRNCGLNSSTPVHRSPYTATASKACRYFYWIFILLDSDFNENDRKIIFFYKNMLHFISMLLGVLVFFNFFPINTSAFFLFFL